MMITYILLLLGTYLFSVTWFSMITNFFVIPNTDWEESHKKMAFKKTIFLFAVLSIILIAICFTGWYLKGNLFFLFFGIILAWNYFAEKRHIKMKQQQQSITR